MELEALSHHIPFHLQGLQPRVVARRQHGRRQRRGGREVDKLQHPQLLAALQPGDDREELVVVRPFEVGRAGAVFEDERLDVGAVLEQAEVRARLGLDGEPEEFECRGVPVEGEEGLRSDSGYAEQFKRL